MASAFELQAKKIMILRNESGLRLQRPLEWLYSPWSCLPLTLFVYNQNDESVSLAARY
jgi:hypothetical protein